MNSFNEDDYRDRQLAKHLEDDESELSNCCNAEIYEYSDVYSEGKEHCVTAWKEREQLRDSDTDDRIEESKNAK